ncbi:pilus assembly protein [Isoptericola halotolerans]|uniref:Flp pilus assembly protein TadG n=1 Tax=Isoptericola halotolerans TaxID=300560 RepID=A0ABX2A451_9MICO|nr:TadE/TadG family type IV pilus assembly protein [Isoptericola halotolerans]NOV97361.1 Flp pilus assembly protein TadG [Isoptericola halotolerans]
MTWFRARRSAEEGSSALELVIVVPVILLIFGAIALGGRIAVADLAVDSAAAEAARTASIARTQGEADSSAARAARATLANQDLDCVEGPTVAVDTSQFANAVGTPATVSATVTCRVNLSGLALPGIPGTRVITKTATSPLDTYRER